MTKPYAVVITAYRVSPRVDVWDVVPIYRSEHTSARAAARRLAHIIAFRSYAWKRHTHTIASKVANSIPRDRAGRYQIEVASENGARYSLNAFRAIHCKESV